MELSYFNIFSGMPEMSNQDYFPTTYETEFLNKKHLVYTLLCSAVYGIHIKMTYFNTIAGISAFTGKIKSQPSTNVINQILESLSNEHSNCLIAVRGLRKKKCAQIR